MNRSLFLVPALATAMLANAQQYVHQVMVLNEGRYDYTAGEQAVPVTLGSYDPATGAYQTVATIPNARFATDVEVQDGVIYVAADTLLMKYDANSYALLDEAVVHGIRHIAIHGDEIVCTEGAYNVELPHFIEVLDKATLDLLYSIPPSELPYSCDGVAISGDKAWIAVNNGFDFGNAVGKVAELDLTTGTIANMIDLGPDGLDPEHIMVHGTDLYTFNNKDFNTSSISKLSIASAAPDLLYSHNVTSNSSCGSSVLSTDHIYFLEYSVGRLARYDLATDAVSDTLASSPVAYGLLNDPIDNVIYATTTDYVSSGELNVMAGDGTVLNTVAIGVSAGSMALDVRSSTGVAQTGRPDVVLYPDPASSALFVRMPQAAPNARLQVLDATGRVLLSQVRDLRTTQRLDIGGLAGGIYFLRINDGAATRFTVK